MPDELSYSLAFAAGVLGGAHCVGMCGSLVSAFFVRLRENGRGILPLMSYHGARIGMYMLVGLIAATLGLALVSTGIIGKTQAILQIAAGLFVIVLGLDLLGVLPARVPVIGLPSALMARLFASNARRGPAAAAAVGGLMNGLMPCALTLAMAVKATTVPHPVQGALLMAAFGLGTLPAMLFVSVLFSRLGAAARAWALKSAAIVVVVFGVLTFTQGVRFFEVMRNLPNW
jgi:hypothetical protein